MVPKLTKPDCTLAVCFRAVLFRMVPKPPALAGTLTFGFRAVLFRMVPKLEVD